MPEARSLPQLSYRLVPLVRARLWLQVLIAMALGVAFGIAIGPTTGWVDSAVAQAVGAWVALPGRLFLLAIQFVVVPLVVASVIRGIAAGEGPAGLGPLGMRTALFFVASTVFAVAVGLVMALAVHPGSFVEGSAVAAALADETGTAATIVPNAPPRMSEIPQLIAGLFPSDPLTTFTSGNMLQIVIAAIILGVAVVMTASEQRRPLLGHRRLRAALRALRGVRLAGADHRARRAVRADRHRHVRRHRDRRAGATDGRLPRGGADLRRPLL